MKMASAKEITLNTLGWTVSKVDGGIAVTGPAFESWHCGGSIKQILKEEFISRHGGYDVAPSVLKGMGVKKTNGKRIMRFLFF